MRRFLCICFLWSLFFCVNAQLPSIKKAAESGDLGAQKYLWKIYLGGKDGVDKNVDLAVKWLSAAAAQNDAESQYKLAELLFGLAYLTPNLDLEKMRECEYWMEKAAQNGHVVAQALWGDRCIEYSKSDAFKYLKAAELKIQDLPDGYESISDLIYDRLGDCYIKGLGIGENSQRAFEYKMKAAKQGSAKAQYYVACCYAEGKNVSRDYKEAIMWYEKSASQGYAWSYNNLAYLYIEGKGVGKNESKAFEMVNKAIKIEPDNLNFYDTKGELYSIVGKQSEAFKVWDMMMEKDSTRVDMNTAFARYILKIRNNVDYEIPLNALNNKNTFALIIANEKYINVAEVPFATNDGKILAEYCKSTLGIPKTNIRFVQNATLNEFGYSLNWLKQITDVYGKSSKVIVYYAGHGIPDEQSKYASLLPIDGYGNDISTGYSLQDLYLQLSKLQSQSIVVFLDACFSGASRSGNMLQASRGVAIKVKNSIPSGNLIVLSASKEDETAYPYSEKCHGMFTYFLLKKLQESRGDASLEDLSRYIREQVRFQSVVVNGKSQTPTFSVSPSLGDSWKTWKLK